MNVLVRGGHSEVFDYSGEAVRQRYNANPKDIIYVANGIHRGQSLPPPELVSMLLLIFHPTRLSTSITFTTSWSPQIISMACLRHMRHAFYPDFILKSMPLTWFLEFTRTLRRPARATVRVGSTLPREHGAFRAEILKIFLKSGTPASPLARIPCDSRGGRTFE